MVFIRYIIIAGYAYKQCFFNILFTIPCFKIVGRCWWFPVPLLSYARQIIKTRKSSGFAERAPQPTKGHDNNDVVHAGRYVEACLSYKQTYFKTTQTELL